MDHFENVDMSLKSAISFYFLSNAGVRTIAGKIRPPQYASILLDRLGDGIDRYSCRHVGGRTDERDVGAAGPVEACV